MRKPSMIIRVVTQKMVPFVFMFGIYIVLNGSSSPGGGFQGGVVMGAAFILFAIGISGREGRLRAPETPLKMIESGGVLLYVVIGLVGILLGYSFLTNKMAHFPPQGSSGSILSGGTLLGINIGIGMHVACTVIALFYAFLEYEPDTDPGKKDNKEAGTT